MHWNANGNSKARSTKEPGCLDLGFRDHLGSRESYFLRKHCSSVRSLHLLILVVIEIDYGMVSHRRCRLQLLPSLFDKLPHQPHRTYNTSCHMNVSPLLEVIFLFHSPAHRFSGTTSTFIDATRPHISSKRKTASLRLSRVNNLPSWSSTTVIIRISRLPISWLAICSAVSSRVFPSWNRFLMHVHSVLELTMIRD